MSKLDTIKRPVVAKLKPTFRSAYSDPQRVQFQTTDARTEQSHKDETDINQILAKYVKGELLEHRINHAQNYGDFTGADFQAAQNTIATANSMFEELPSSVRNRFQNDPAKFLDFVGDDKNHDEMVSMGLAKAKIEPVKDEPVAAKADTVADEVSEMDS